MPKYFNVTGACNPNRHYMVDLTERLCEIKQMVDNGDYFTINKGRQYGKTTTLKALANYLKDDYVVLSLDFQRMSNSDYKNEFAFVTGLARLISQMSRYTEGISSEIKERFRQISKEKEEELRLAEIFECFTDWCEESEKSIVLIIDEVDTASNNQVFLDFLAQLRAGYLERDAIPTFQSVILAGVYDIRNIKRKIRPDEEHKHNSPWNIAADFLVDMNFSIKDISGMLKEYEKDHNTGMDIILMSQLLYDYTSGYPYLVSRLCKLIDEQILEKSESNDKKTAWTKEDILKAVKILLEKSCSLFESLMGKLETFPELSKLIARLLFTGEKIPYNIYDTAIQDATMFGFIKAENSSAVIANRIFEACLYNKFLLSYKEQNSEIFSEGTRSKNQFVVDGRLNVRLVLEKFVKTFDSLYGNESEAFLEDEGRKYFMLFLKPIINGVGNCYVEAQTRDHERMDLVIDYNGEQSVIEMKIWHGDAYNKRGEDQLVGYLDHFGLKKGYMLSFNFNKNKTIGVNDVVVGDKLIVEAVV